jgi:hypothetical protein
MSPTPRRNTRAATENPAGSDVETVRICLNGVGGQRFGTDYCVSVNKFAGAAVALVLLAYLAIRVADAVVRATGSAKASRSSGP